LLGDSAGAVGIVGVGEAVAVVIPAVGAIVLGTNTGHRRTVEMQLAHRAD
jgi:hypothetical protein